MHARAVVEIVPGTDGQIPAALLQGLYRASAQGLMVLALRGIKPRAVDLVLDDVVRLLPLNIPGVLYVDAEDEDAVLEAARDADAIFISTRAFEGRVSASGIAPDFVHPVARVLELLGRVSLQSQELG